MIPENNFILSECECGALISFPEIDLQSSNPPFSLSGNNNVILELVILILRVLKLILYQVLIMCKNLINLLLRQPLK